MQEYGGKSLEAGYGSACVNCCLSVFNENLIYQLHVTFVGLAVAC